MRDEDDREWRLGCGAAHPLGRMVGPTSGAEMRARWPGSYESGLTQLIHVTFSELASLSARENDLELLPNFDAA